LTVNKFVISAKKFTAIAPIFTVNEHQVVKKNAP